MLDNTIRLTLIYGSTRDGRLCDAMVEWVESELSDRAEFLIDRLDPRAFDLSGGSTTQAELEQRIDSADAFIVVTPEYNHGYPAPLKALIDAVYTPWKKKPVGFVSYGGTSGGLRAAEQLRQVFGELQAVDLRDGVSFSSPWESLDAGGKLVAPAGKRQALMRMLDHLVWWARVLRDARLSPAVGEPDPEASPGFYSVIDYTVDGPETQRRLVEAFADLQEQWVNFYPGYRSATLLGSLDGSRVYNLVHWASEAAFRQFEATSNSTGRGEAIQKAIQDLSGHAEPRMSEAPRYVVMRKVGPRRRSEEALAP